ncbi:hypothetical protein B0H16DRAFT_1210358, partial [Mycena metata]
LRSSSAAFLVSSSPIQSSSEPPRLPPVEISPEKARNIFLLSAEPTTVLEGELQAALRREQDRNRVQMRQLVAMQSALVLNGAYIDLVHGQLEAQEKKTREKKKGGRLVGDGLPRLLTVREFEQQAAEKAEGLKERRANREERSEATKVWKALDDERKEQNKEIKQEWAIRVTEWEAERDLAKQQYRRLGWKKPTL